MEPYDSPFFTPLDALTFFNLDIAQMNIIAEHLVAMIDDQKFPVHRRIADFRHNAIRGCQHSRLIIVRIRRIVA